MPITQPDILLIGGGVIGLTTALRLADRGVAVTVLERNSVGGEASWAGAGMLPPGNLPHAVSPESRLRSYSHLLWSDLSADLLDRTGIDNGYHICGAIEVFDSQELSRFSGQLGHWKADGVNARVLQSSEALEMIPGLSTDFEAFAFLADFGQVRNPRHLQALKIACIQKGVEIIENVESLSLRHQGDRIREVRLLNRALSFEKVCVTAGAWSASVLDPLGFSIPIRPVRGQIVQLDTRDEHPRCIIEHGRQYLVPRRDGLSLVGSTEEDAGFEKQNTDQGVSELLRFAGKILPSLASATILRSWAGLRPGTPDELPLIGKIPRFLNAFIGAGHFRSGLQMSPGTASILADLMLDSHPAVSIEGFEPERFAGQS